MMKPKQSNQTNVFPVSMAGMGSSGDLSDYESVDDLLAAENSDKDIESLSNQMDKKIGFFMRKTGTKSNQEKLRDSVAKDDQFQISRDSLTLSKDKVKPLIWADIAGNSEEFSSRELSQDFSVEMYEVPLKQENSEEPKKPKQTSKPCLSPIRNQDLEEDSPVERRSRKIEIDPNQDLPISAPPSS